MYTPNFWNFSLPDSDLVEDIAVGDFNKDGLDDLVVSYSDPSSGTAGVDLLLNSSTPTGRSVTNYSLGSSSSYGQVAGGEAVGDLNGDGNLDVFLDGGDTDPVYSLVNVAFGDGKGHLAPWTSYIAASINGGQTALADIQGKGALDALILDESTPYPSIVQALFNRGNGVFDVQPELLPNSSIPLLPSVQGMELVDLTGDSKPDLVLLLSSNYSAGADAVAIYPNSGVAPYYQSQSPYIVPLPTNGGTFKAGNLVASDFTNDGLNDLFITSATGRPECFCSTTPRKTCRASRSIFNQEKSPPATTSRTLRTQPPPRFTAPSTMTRIATE